MAHLWNNILVVTPYELEPWLNIKALQQQIHRTKNKNYGIKRVRIGGKGREMLIDYDSLPTEIRNSIKDPRKHDNILELFYQPDAAAVKFYSEYQFEDGTHLGLTHQELYITNASVLKAIIALREARIRERKSKGGSIVKGLMASLVNDAEQFNTTLKDKYNSRHTLPHSEKRFKLALKEFENIGYASLVSKKHKNTNSQKMTDDLLGLLNALFASQSHKPTRTEVARQYNAFLTGKLQVLNENTGELYNSDEYQRITEATIINWLGKWDQRIATYAMRSGNRQQFMSLFQPYHSLRQPKYAGSIISVDDRQPPFTYGMKKRVWFYNGIDLGSEVFTTAVYGNTKEGIILDFYREMVRNYHEWGLPLPAELEGELSLNSSYKDSFLMPGRMFDYVRIEANNARGKRIEAFYRQLRYDIEKSRIGWLARPFANSEANQIKPEEVPTLPYETIVNNALKDLQTWNNMPHSKYKDISRWDWHLDNMHPDLKPINYKGIIPFLGYTTSTSCNAGIIKLQNAEYLIGDNDQLFFAEKLIKILSILEDAKMTVKWLDTKDGEVMKAYAYVGETYICQLIPKPTYSRAKIEQTEEDYIARENMSKYVASINGYLRAKKGGLVDVLVLDERSHTISNTYRIRGINGEYLDEYEVSNEDAELVPDAPEMDENNELKTDYKLKSLNERF